MKQRLLYLYRWTMWNILSRIFVRFWLKPKYNFFKSAHSDPLPRPPFIIVANHGTFFDPWIIGYFSRYPLAIMCNDDAFRGSAVTRWYLQSIGAFPKKKGAQDFSAMKKTVSLLSSDYPVCIFPEGQTSWDGETQLLYKGIEKIIRHSRVPLVMVRSSGNFLTKPWWADRLRRGRIECLFTTLTPDYIQSIPEHALFLEIKAFIAHNDIKAHAADVSTFSGTALAEGLQRFVWICMHCESEDTLSMKGNVIRCSACGSSWSISALCRLSALKSGIKSFPDLHDWAQWHKIKVRARVRTATNGDVLTTGTGIRLQSSAGGAEFTDQGTCALILTKENLTCTYHHKGDTLALSLPVAEIADCVIQRKDLAEVRHGSTYYRFAHSGHSPMKWVYYLRYIKGFETFEKQGYIG
jgi:hypothetical protein